MATKRSRVFDSEDQFPYQLFGGATRDTAISGLNPAFSKALIDFYNAAPPEVQAELGLNSAYRDFNTQQALWDKSDKSGKWVAKPGTSKHNKGLAADLYGFGLTKGKRVSDATRNWVNQNAGQYGLTFPMEHEPWHIQLAQEQAQQMAAQGYSPEQIKKAFLDTIASTEANSYDVMYGGEKFSDFSKHPERDMPIFKGSQITGHSSAAGRYQFLKDTWREQAAKYGYKDFSPETQDTAAWNYASDIFKQKGGGDLMEALSSNDPARQNAAAQILNQTWTSLPGGAEQAKGYGNQTFADVFRKSLGATADSPSEGGSRFGGTGLGTPATGGATTLTAKENKFSPQKMGEAMASGEGMGQMQGTTVPDLPRAAIHQAEPSGLDPQNLERRKQLAQMMLARLNSGKLMV